MGETVKKLLLITAKQSNKKVFIAQPMSYPGSMMLYVTGTMKYMDAYYITNYKTHSEWLNIISTFFKL